ncbi:integrator complex subunit 12 [Biomphalaria glabrata]|nr:integrator complex subunit 12-like isoform X2 [Biomphalaria glabrata]XP_055877589.1 integrator complex subunit 12-like isoform X2 [Biomphalaria glabrata]KAI8764773.1 integrator complex subunit 12-like [Biomphalaria glabrata]
MSAVELDPVFVKALKLLHSRAKDSSAQLKAMLDDAIAQRKGLKLPSQNVDSHSSKSSPSRSKSDDDTKKKDAEKRPADKMHKDLSEPDIKKLKLDSKSKIRDEKEAREREKEKERQKREKEKKAKEERDAQKQKEKAEKERKEKELSTKQETEVMMISDEEEPASQMETEDFALEMGIACVVCRQFEVSSGNQLVECQECHTLYHQECHKPPVTEEDVSDPRFVWYCSRCTKSLKKMVTQKPVKPKPLPPVSTSSGSSTLKESVSSSAKSGKTETSSSSSQAFRRIDPKAIVTPKEAPILSSTTSKPMVGLEGLAANLAKPRGESKGGSSRKPDQKGEGSKSSNKADVKPSSGNKSDSSSKSSSSSSSSSKNDERKTESKSSNKDEKEKKSGNKGDEKKSSDVKSVSTPSTPAFSPASQTLSSKEDKKFESTLRSEPTEQTKPAKSPAHLSKLEISSAKSLSPQPLASPAPDSPTSSKSNSTAINKQAVANLSMVTANKRMQMMKKKAQTKPEKKIHIK